MKPYVLLLFLLIWRLLIPTRIDWEPQAFHKDLMHLLLGGLFLFAWQRDRLLFILLILLSLFELFMAFVPWKGII